eukprot:360637-Chlamydomonas_euryale.AAC.9
MLSVVFTDTWCNHGCNSGGGCRNTVHLHEEVTRALHGSRRQTREVHPGSACGLTKTPLPYSFSSILWRRTKHPALSISAEVHGNAPNRPPGTFELYSMATHQNAAPLPSEQ